MDSTSNNFNLDIRSKNKMKIIFKTFLLYFLLQNFVIAACDFKADFGEKKNIFETKNFVGRPFPMEHVGLEVFPILANDVCPNERLEDVGIEYRFLFDELITFCLIVNKYLSSKDIFFSKVMP